MKKEEKNGSNHIKNIVKYMRNEKRYDKKSVRFDGKAGFARRAGEIDFSDIPFENREFLGEHQFRTVKSAPRVSIFERVR